jgi:hypothetical protein
MGKRLEEDGGICFKGREPLIKEKKKETRNSDRGTETREKSIVTMLIFPCNPE